MAEISPEIPQNLVEDNLKKDAHLLVDTMVPEAMLELYEHLRAANMDPVVVPAVWAIDKEAGQKILEDLEATPVAKKLQGRETKAGKPVVNSYLHLTNNAAEEQVGFAVVFPEHGVTREETVINKSAPSHKVVIREGLLITAKDDQLTIGQATYQQHLRTYLGVQVMSTHALRFLGFTPPPFPIPGELNPSKVAGLLFAKFNSTYRGELHPINRSIDYVPRPANMSDISTRFKK